MALYKSEQVLPVALSCVTEQSLVTRAAENSLRKLGYDRIKPATVAFTVNVGLFTDRLGHEEFYYCTAWL